MNVLAAARPAPPLHDLLGASFEFNSLVTALAWDGGIACFGLANGAIALLPSRWDGAPRLEPRPGGGTLIIAGEKPPPPPVLVTAHQGAVLALAGDPLGGIISGGADGAVLRIVDGVKQDVAQRDRRHIAAVAAGRGGRRAFAAGRQVDRLGPDAGRLNLPGPAVALSYDPSGLHLAAGWDGGVTLEAAGIREAPRFTHDGAFTHLAWRPDGEAFAASNGALIALRQRAQKAWTTLEDFPGLATAIAYAADGAIAVAGADFAVLRRDTAPPTALPRGIAPIACHPRLNLAACADRDGGILIFPLAGGGALTVRDAGAALTHLAFAPDGQALAFAAADGEAGTVMLPDILFRFGEKK
jgi:hypothetical protein